MNAIIELLKKEEIKPTLLRVEILKYLMEQKTHPSPEEICKHLDQANITFSRAAVYNTLNLFESKDIIIALKGQDGHFHYDAELFPHAHFECSECNLISNIDLKLDLTKMEELKACEIRNVDIVIHGICSRCKAESLK